MANRFLTSSSSNVTGVKRTRIEMSDVNGLTDSVDTHNAHRIDGTLHFSQSDIDHSVIQGLSDDGHPQYARVDTYRGDSQEFAPRIGVPGMRVYNNTGQSFVSPDAFGAMTGIAFNATDLNGNVQWIAGVDCEYGPNLSDVQLVFGVKDSNGDINRNVGISGGGEVWVHSVRSSSVYSSGDVQVDGLIYSQTPSCNVYATDNQQVTVIPTPLVSFPIAFTVTASEYADNMMHESPGKLRYTHGAAARMSINATLSFTPETANPVTWRFYLYIENAPNPWQEIPGARTTTSTQSTDIVSVSLCAMTDMSANSTVQLWVSNQTNSDNLTCIDCSITAFRFPVINPANAPSSAPAPPAPGPPAPAPPPAP